MSGPSEAPGPAAAGEPIAETPGATVHERVVEAVDRPVFVVRPTERDDPEE